MSASAARRHPPNAFWNSLLDTLSNVLFPVVVFFFWAAATAIGTIVDQNQPAQHYYDMYPPYVANLVLRLHLDTILHSIPYFSLIVLLLASMTVCTFRRVIPKRFPKDRAVPIENFGLHATVASPQRPNDAAEAAALLLRRRGFRLRVMDIDGARWLFGDKHRWARYGVLVAHLGFAVIALGVFAGWLAGFKGQLQIFDGDTAAVPERPALRIRLDKFTAQFEPVQTPSGVFYQASKFQSDVLVDDGTERRSTGIVVNHPLVVSKVYFYQAAYGFGARFALHRNGKPVTLTGARRLMPQDAIFLPGTSREIQYMTMLGPSDPSQVPVGVPLPKTNEYAVWEIHDNVPTTNRPIFIPVGKTIDAGDGYTLTALPPVAWSGLTYRYDPGEGFVGLGAGILVAGFVMALFFVPVKLYARVRGAAAGSAVDVAATTTKGNAIYESEFTALVAALSRAAGPPGKMSDEVEKAYA